ncbi:FtsK/SpoIIIE domain-containing protein [Staphylococcus haemolyticus]|uniref:FtsK/SpoIIIE domain-containing protein n=1 Tax=Staphylococcus haemolyticus TaxID=1283 RepID=UPI001F0ACFA9|nr:FtsK/SpoIIIE domain-containing protein [Staphylococcus haemolyticus]MCH4446783.1 hypothetical protein [Staphylococcus haemolyticus]
MRVGKRDKHTSTKWELFKFFIGLTGEKNGAINEFERAIFDKIGVTEDEEKEYQDEEIGTVRLIKRRQNFLTGTLSTLARIISRFIGVMWSMGHFSLGFLSVMFSEGSLLKLLFTTFLIWVIFVWIIPMLILSLNFYNVSQKYGHNNSKSVDVNRKNIITEFLSVTFGKSVSLPTTVYDKRIIDRLNLKHIKASINRKKEFKYAYQLGSEIAIKMGLWNERDDAYLNAREGRYQALAFNDDGDITFSIVQKPTNLTQIKLLKASENVKDEYGTKMVKDGRNVPEYSYEYNGKIYKTENTVVTRIKNGLFYVPKKFTIILYSNNPLKNGKQVYKAEEIIVKDRPLSVEVAIDMDGNREFMDFDNKSSMLIGGLPGSGKSAGLLTSSTALLKSGLVDLSIGDMKGVSSEWDSFVNVADVFKLEEDDETHERNLQEVLERIQAFSRENVRRFEEFKKRTGTDNFWSHPISPNHQLRMMILDECQEIFDTSAVDKEEKAIINQIIKECTAIVKKQRSMGVMLVLATQRPDRNSIPKSVSDNASLRYTFRVATKEVETMVLGARPDNVTVSAVDIPRDGMQGTAISGDAENRKMIRFNYMDIKDIQKELAEIEQMQKEGSFEGSMSQEEMMKQGYESAMKHLEESFRKSDESFNDEEDEMIEDAEYRELDEDYNDEDYEETEEEREKRIKREEIRNKLFNK